jgi:leader peptidase (prepilin peptidase) / N-methyltransferase
MSLFILAGIFFLGACVGSFFAVLLDNNPLHRSFWTGRSQCLSCKKILQWYELIPLFSYALQGEKCRGCHTKIPRWIWYTEWYMAFLWMSVTMVLSFTEASIFSIIIHIVLLTWLSFLVIEDIRWKTISDTRSVPLMVCIIGIFVVLAYFPTFTLLPSWFEALVGALVGMLFYMLQMILPSLWHAFHKRRFKDIGAILVSPVLFPLWLGTKYIV